MRPPAPGDSTCARVERDAARHFPSIILKAVPWQLSGLGVRHFCKPHTNALLKQLYRRAICHRRERLKMTLCVDTACLDRDTPLARVRKFALPLQVFWTVWRLTVRERDTPH